MSEAIVFMLLSLAAVTGWSFAAAFLADGSFWRKQAEEYRDLARTNGEGWERALVRERAALQLAGGVFRSEMPRA